MAKLTGPLLSFGARGQIGKTLVAASWRGVKYARQHVVPANPQTAAQQAVRTLFAFLREMWKLAPGGLSAPWDAFAQGRPLTGMNKFVGENVRVLNGDADLTDFIASPGAKGGTPLATFSTGAGALAGELVINFTNPTPPTGWTNGKIQWAVVHQQDPTGIFDGDVTFGSALATATKTTVTGLQSGESYVCSAWTKQTKPDGTTAYGVSNSGVQVAHA